MIFAETFLQSEDGRDCLALVLSFLTCNELAAVARTCKSLCRVIFFDNNDNQDQLNLLWEGAEEALTFPSDINQWFLFRRERIGVNAREHCHLFALASKAAKACEFSDEIKQDRVKADGLLANLMNVRWFDPEILRKEIEEAVGSTMVQGEGEEEDDSSEEKKGADEEAYLKKMFLSLMMEDAYLIASEKVFHHEVFVRISRASTGEVISQGFCNKAQRLPWIEGLEAKQDDCPSILKQGLELTLDFASLFQTKEMDDFVKHYLENFSGDNSCACCNLFEAFDGFQFGFNITAMVIDKRDYSLQCLFQQNMSHESQLRHVVPTPKSVDGRLKHEFVIYPTWGYDTVQLGPSPYTDRYRLSMLFLSTLVHHTLGSNRLILSRLFQYWM